MKVKTILTFLAVVFLGAFLFAQRYEVKIIPESIEGLSGLQSYAVGSYNGEWLIVGGRKDGLHKRRPFESFDTEGKNQEIFVVNPKSKQVWKSSLSELSGSIAEQLSSTNMQFYQDEDMLICTGGYGYSPTEEDHITYPFLTVINLPIAIESIKNNKIDVNAFIQLKHEDFRVTGGALNKIGDVYYLVGGHKFMGRYNPMGPNHGPGFVQEYTNEARRFTLDLSGALSVTFYDPIHDEMHLHRRDYNLVPYLNANERALMVFSGVFKNTSDLPWLYPVSIDQNNHVPIEDFSQYYNHYHCAYLPIYDARSESMQSLFFGGIAQYYEDDGWLVQDNDVPFVNTIAEVNLSKEGILTESIMSDTMPGYLGAGAVFIIDDGIGLADDDIVDASIIGDDYTEVGYIYGGIRSTLPNIFWMNTGEQSEASSVLYRVAIRRKDNTSSITSFGKKEKLQFYPNPAQGLVRMAITLDYPEEITVSISDESGREVSRKKIHIEETKAGANVFVLDNIDIGYGAFYYRVKLKSTILSRKVIWSE